MLGGESPTHCWYSSVPPRGRSSRHTSCFMYCSMFSKETEPMGRVGRVRDILRIHPCKGDGRRADGKVGSTSRSGSCCLEFIEWICSRKLGQFLCWTLPEFLLMQNHCSSLVRVPPDQDEARPHHVQEIRIERFFTKSLLSLIVIALTNIFTPISRLMFDQTTGCLSLTKLTHKINSHLSLVYHLLEMSCYNPKKGL